MAKSGFIRSKYGKPVDEVYLLIDFSAILALKPELEKVKRAMWEEIASRHKKMLFRRFITLSSRTMGGQQWAPLKTKTVNTKRWYMKQEGLSGNPAWILRRSSRLAYGMSYIVRENGYIVGYLRDAPHAHSEYTVAQLADLHQKGFGKTPARPIIVRPDRRAFGTLVDIAQNWFDNAIKAANSKNKVKPGIKK